MRHHICRGAKKRVSAPEKVKLRDSMLMLAKHIPALRKHCYVDVGSSVPSYELALAGPLSSLKFLGRVRGSPCMDTELEEDYEFSSFCTRRSINCERYMPAHMSNKLSIDATLKYDFVAPNVEKHESQLLLALEWLKVEFGLHMKNSSIKKYSDLFVNADGGRFVVDFSRSAGFPFNREFKDSGEAYLDADFHSWVDYCVREAREGNGPTCLWNSFLKDELRAAEKVGRPRQINGCGADLKVIGNMLFLEQNENFYSAHTVTSSQVGMAKEGLGWNKLYQKLSKYKHGLDIDVSKYDAHMHRRLLFLIRDFRKECYRNPLSAQDSALVDWYYDQIVDSALVVNTGDVLLKELGNPSGSVNTVVDNTLVLFIMFALCYIVACERSGCEPTYDSFHECVVLALYGDDSTFTCHPLVRRMMTPALIREIFLDFGWEVTVGDKNHQGDGDDWKPLNELAFLSAKFKKIDTNRGAIIVPQPVDFDKCLSSLRVGGNDPASKYIRACQLRQIYFFCDKIHVVEDYLNELEQNHWSVLIDHKFHRKPASDIVALYTASGLVTGAHWEIENGMQFI